MAFHVACPITWFVRSQNSSDFNPKLSLFLVLFLARFHWLLFLFLYVAVDGSAFASWGFRRSCRARKGGLSSWRRLLGLRSSWPIPGRLGLERGPPYKSRSLGSQLRRRRLQPPTVSLPVTGTRPCRRRRSGLCCRGGLSRHRRRPRIMRGGWKMASLRWDFCSFWLFIVFGLIWLWSLGFGCLLIVFVDFLWVWVGRMRILWMECLLLSL